MQRSLAAALALATLVAPRLSAAEAPEGWALPKLDEARPEPRTPRQRLLDRAAPPAPTIASPRTLAIDPIPVVTTQPRVTLDAWGPRPTALPQSIAPAPELIVLGTGERGATRAVRIALRGDRLGTITHRFAWDGEAHPGQRGGAGSECGAAARIDPLQWTSVRLRDDGALDVVTGTGWFNGYTCRVVVVQRSEAIARALVRNADARGVLYGYRAHCESCEPSRRDALQLVWTTLAKDFADGRDPNSDRDWKLSFAALPLSPHSQGQHVFGLSTGSTAPRRQLVVEAQRPGEASAQVLLYERPINEAQFLF